MGRIEFPVLVKRIGIGGGGVLILIGSILDPQSTLRRNFSSHAAAAAAKIEREVEESAIVNSEGTHELV